MMLMVSMVCLRLENAFGVTALMEKSLLTLKQPALRTVVFCAGWATSTTCCWWVSLSRMEPMLPMLWLVGRPSSPRLLAYHLSSIVLSKNFPTFSMLGRRQAWNSVQLSTWLRHLSRSGSKREGQGRMGVHCFLIWSMIFSCAASAVARLPVSTKNATRPKENTSAATCGGWCGYNTTSGATQTRVPPRGFACLVSVLARPKSSSFMRWKPLRPGTCSATMFDAFKSPCTTGGPREWR
mmetsp:Transcript_47588/g.114233  ORF Transcript_47588/g.114233 Transcript_47588/m.114233 type:complete len:238 (-) Transcript_47588:853-1566(-)